MAEQYCDNFYEDTLDTYMQDIPESLRHIYEDSRGILVYQEQIMQLSMEMAGYTMGGADILRRAIGKKDKNLIQAVQYEFVYGTAEAIPRLEAALSALDPAQDKKKHETFAKELKSLKAKDVSVEGCVARGFDEAYSIQTYEAIERFSGYSFNRSHSAAYAMIAYWTAYLKTHYPVEFMAAQLTVEAGDSDDTLSNIAECRRLNIEVLPPDINKSDLGYTIENAVVTTEEGQAVMKDGELVMKKAIRFGLKSIKGVGPGVIQAVMARPPQKDENGTVIPDTEGTPYANMDDFFHRVDKRKVNKSYIEKLIKSGCFDFDLANRHQMLNHFYFNLRGDKKYAGGKTQYDKDKAAKKVKADTALELDPMKYDEDQICAFEEELIGFYLTHHPYAELPYRYWEDVAPREEVDMGGKIVKVKKILTKKKDHMCFLEVDTAGGKIDVTVFPSTFAEYEHEMFKGNIAVFRGKKEMKDDGKPQMILNKVVMARKKKFKVVKPPELEELAAERRKEKKGKRQATLEDFGGVTVKDDPMGDTFDQSVPKPADDLGDLATLF